MRVGLRTKCPHCGRDAAVSESQFGSTVRCPTCFREFAFESVRFGSGGDRRPGGREAGPPTPPRTSADRTRVAATDEPRRELGAIGRFELRERVGEGTFGVVFRAFDPVLDREVAVKIPQVVFADDRAARRFLAEAKAAARLRHPGIVAVHEAGLADGRPYIATEFVRGRTLADRLKAGRPPVDLAASWVRDLARALAYAHSEGVVHRDVKPGNVMLDEHDRPQLMDFGLARNVDSDSSLTAEGSLLGTPAYMSPEQARSEPAVGPKSDQYSLGVVLYELLTGARPFVGPPHAVVTQVASAEEPPSVRSRDPSLPRDLDSICRKAMEKDPARRYDDAAAFADDLARWLAGHETLARPLGPLERAKRWARRSPAVASLAAAVVVTASIGFAAVLHQWQQAVSSRRDAQRHLVRAQTAQREKEGLLTEKQKLLDEVERQRDAARTALAVAERRGKELTAALDESNRNLAEATRQKTRADAAGAEAARLSDRVVGEQAEADRQRSEAARLSARRDLERAQQLADADKVSEAFLAAARALASLPAESADLETHLRMQLALLRRLLHEPTGMIDAGRPLRAIDVDPAGRLVATGDEDGTFRIWHAERGTEALPARTYDGPVRAVRFAPDGEQLLVCAGADTAELIRLGGDAEPKPLRHPARVLSAAFDGQGRKIATGAEDRLARVWTAAAARLAFPPLEHDAPVRAVALSPDGAMLLTGTAAPARRVTLWDANTGRSIAILHEGPAEVAGVAFSGDGRLMAAGLSDGLVRFWRTEDRAGSRRNLKVEGPIRSLAFTSTGRLLVASGDGTARLWDVEEGRPEGQPLIHDGAVTVAACESDGHGLVTAGEDGVVRRWRSAMASSAEGPVPQDSAARKIALRGDGTLLATGDVKGHVRLFDLARGLAVGETVTLAAPVSALASGRGVIAAGGEDGTARLLSADSATPVGLRMRHDAAVNSLSFSADGRLLLSVERDGPARLWDGETGKPAGQTLRLEGGVRTAAIAPGGSVIAAAGTGRLRIWSAQAEPVSEVLATTGRVVSLAFSGDGGLLVAGTDSGDVTRWDAKAGRQLAPVFSHGGPLHTVVVSPDGRLAATAGPGRDVRLWDAETGEPLGPPLTHGDDVVGLRFLGDGRFLVTATRAGDVQFWDAVLGRRVGLPLRSSGPLIDLAISEDGVVLAAASEQTPPWFWKVPPPVRVAQEDIVAWAEAVTGLAAGGEPASALDPREWQERRRGIGSDGQEATTGEP